MFFELKKNDANETNVFKQRYFEMIKYRMAFASLELEGIDDDLADVKQSMKIFNQLDAITYIFENANENKPLSHMEFTNLLCNVAERVSGGEIDNFRTTTAMVNGSSVPRSKPEMVRNDLWYLIDDYNYQRNLCKQERDLYKLEARFHIRLLHIHPFEDGNGRTARIFLTYNMCKNDLAPCIITKENKQEYCDLIEKGDEKGLADLFEEMSKKEFDTMVSLYRELDEKGLIEDNKMTDAQEEEYKKMRAKL